jgi:hypothetical protein
MKFLTVAGLAALLLAAPALAQQPAPPAGLSTQGESIGIPPPNPSQNTTSDLPAPAFHVFGLPVGISAPVNSPYMQSATTTFAGQPMNGADAVVARGIGSNVAE